MKGFIRLTNVYQDAPTIVNIHAISYFYRQDVGNKHTVISTLGSQHCLSVKEDFDEVVKMIEKELAEAK
jgi:hypothetical protein